MRKRFIVTMAITVSLLLVLAGQTLYAGSKCKDIQKLYKGHKAFAHIEALVGFGPRVAGGAEERAAADYIAAKMERYGLDVEIQEFPMVYFEDFGSELSVEGGSILSPNTIGYSPAGVFTSEIVLCGLGYPSDFPPEVAGRIALIQRGELYFSEKTANAAAAGALAVIIYNNEEGNFFGTLGAIGDISAVSISLEDGEYLVELLAGDAVVVSYNVDTEAYESTSQNIIGTLEGTQPEQGIVYIGGHYDSVSAGPGANDNASGAAGMLEAARVLAKKGHRTKATLKFIAFGAEEIGLDGSYNYVIENEEEITNNGLGMINLDMIGVGDTLLIGCIGYAAPDLTDYTQEKAVTMGIEDWEAFTADTNSDHTYFEMA
ncbi:MAG: M20/M25/M40 family metallo-hydrolase, partial [Desulfobacteraceae bacterium]|nr:M20/M25/M40 family metallo-hydrolase [Desulfobacteraceae bacterium]